MTSKHKRIQTAQGMSELATTTAPGKDGSNHSIINQMQKATTNSGGFTNSPANGVKHGEQLIQINMTIRIIMPLLTMDDRP
jgi:hypothetical protein